MLVNESELGQIRQNVHAALLRDDAGGRIDDRGLDAAGQCRVHPRRGAADLHQRHILAGSQANLRQGKAGDEIRGRAEAADRDGAAF